jgi:hypothetical protein
MTSYSDMTKHEFDCILMEILQETKASELIAVPGFYDVAAEEFNNEVLERWRKKKEEEEDGIPY